jgi:hypothetical protein
MSLCTQAALLVRAADVSCTDGREEVPLHLVSAEQVLFEIFGLHQVISGPQENAPLAHPLPQVPLLVRTCEALITVRPLSSGFSKDVHGLVRGPSLANRWGGGTVTDSPLLLAHHRSRSEVGPSWSPRCSTSELGAAASGLAASTVLDRDALLRCVASAGCRDMASDPGGGCDVHNKG